MEALAFVLVLLLLLIATALPVMLGARMVKVRNTGLGPALLAVVLLSASSALLEKFVVSDVLAFVGSIVLAAIILALTLGTSLLRGLAVGIVAVALQFAVLLLLVGVLDAAGAM